MRSRDWSQTDPQKRESGEGTLQENQGAAVARTSGAGAASALVTMVCRMRRLASESGSATSGWRSGACARYMRSLAATSLVATALAGVGAETAACGAGAGAGGGGWTATLGGGGGVAATGAESTGAGGGAATNGEGAGMDGVETPAAVSRFPRLPSHQSTPAAHRAASPRKSIFDRRVFMGRKCTRITG